MKKITWILVLSMILAVIPIYHSNVVYGQNVDSLKFENIESLIIKQNPIIKINKNMKKNLSDSIEAIKDAKYDKRDLEDAIDGMDEAIDGLNGVVKQQEMMINSLKQLLPSEKGISSDSSKELEDSQEKWESELDLEGVFEDLTNVYTQAIGIPIGTIKSIQVLYEFNIKSLEQNRDAMKEQLKEFDRLPAKEMELEKAIFQIDMGNESIVWGAQNLYLGYNTLKSKRDELVQNLELLDSQIAIMILQEKLGMITSLELKGISNQREQIEFGINSLEVQMNNLLGELNLMLDEDFDRPIKLEDSFIVDKDFISKIDYKDDMRMAKRNSYSIKLKDYDYDIQANNMDWANRHGSSDEYRAAKRNLENAKIEFNQESKNLELTFSKVYQELQIKMLEIQNENNSLEYEKEKYEISEIKYGLGMLSKIEFDEARVNYDRQNNTIEAMEQELFQIVLQYKGLLKGMNFMQ